MLCVNQAGLAVVSLHRHEDTADLHPLENFKGNGGLLRLNGNGHGRSPTMRVL
ncbi:MAG: hypothetical protein JJU32_13440 [Phormidium sp. BM_Day4_Bin.17]|nr:hypothetical protein [Phormidium sp. BM_Day4_Bin.17]UCJ13964.1 MAG: hypothetical protein JWS08_09700 [Phormidium sp. PBR-2020]